MPDEQAATLRNLTCVGATGRHGRVLRDAGHQAESLSVIDWPHFCLYVADSRMEVRSVVGGGGRFPCSTVISATRWRADKRGVAFGEASYRGPPRQAQLRYLHAEVGNGPFAWPRNVSARWHYRGGKYPLGAANIDLSSGVEGSEGATIYRDG